ncbi:MAG: hypothetical protein GDA36_12295 [Rhodobacteraceae bacterium]|nr:hypothetical protein [Paracoccaceae bacterium]
MHLLLRKAAVRIGEDDVLTRIDAPVGWRWFSPTCKPRVGALRDRVSGFMTTLIRFKCLLIGQGHGPRGPKLVRVPSTAVGFHAVLRPRPLMHLCPMRRPVAVFATRW